MQSVLKTGMCVSCGRNSGRHVRVCPYCDEQVWQPFWLRAGRWCVLLLPPVFLTCQTCLAQPDWQALTETLRKTPPTGGFLFAAGIGLLSLPAPDADRVVHSQSELRNWQLVAIAGGWFMGTLTAASTAVLCHGQPGPGAWLSATGMALCLLVMPFFLRIPWRSLTASLLLASAIVTGVLKYAG